MTESTSAPASPAAINQTSALAFFAADHVAATPDAKLYVNGGFFALLRFPAFPATLATLGIGAVIELPFHDQMHDHTIRIGVGDLTTRSFQCESEAAFRTAPSLEAQFGEPGIVPFGVTLTNVQIPTAGAYNLVLWLDDIEIKTYRLRAVQIPTITSSGAQPPSQRHELVRLESWYGQFYSGRCILLPHELDFSVCAITRLLSVSPGWL